MNVLLWLHIVELLLDKGNHGKREDGPLDPTLEKAGKC